MIRSDEAMLLFSDWISDRSPVRAALTDSDNITRCVIEDVVSKVDNALIEITNAREGMTVNIVGAVFEYGDSRDFSSREVLYSDLIRVVLQSGLNFAVAVLRTTPTK
jgi:hypothetical protein